MASNKYNLNTWSAKRVLGDNQSQNPAGSLLQSGAGRADDSTTGDTWIFWDTLGGTSTPWGLRHAQLNNRIDFIGAGTIGAWIQMNTGNVYFRGNVGLGTESPGYKLEVQGSSYFLNTITGDILSSWHILGGRPSNTTNFNTYFETATNLHHENPARTDCEISYNRWFASNSDQTNYGPSTLNLPVVDSHVLSFGIDNGAVYSRHIAFDIRTNAVYVKARNNNTWTGWEQLVRDTGSWSINAATATKLSNTPNNTTTFLRGDNTWTNTLTNTFISTASPGFTNSVAAGAWAYLRLNTSAYYWDLATNSSASSNHFEIRGNGGDTYKFRFTTDGRLDIYNEITSNNSLRILCNGGESSICYADKSGAYTTWTVGRGPGNIGSTFGWWNGSKNVMTLTNDGKLHLSGPCQDSVGAFSVTDTRTDAGWHYPFLGLSPNIAAGGNVYICIGQTANTGNSAGLRYQWNGANSDSNLLGFEFYGKGTPFYVRNTGFTYVNGTINIWPNTGNYTEGIRIHPYSNWATIMLCGTDNTGDSGTTANSWGLFNNNGNFYITRNGSNNGVVRFQCESNHWEFCNLSNSDYNYGGSALWIREYGYTGASSDTWGQAPRLGWHWSGRVAAQIGLASNGYLYEAPLTATNFYKIVIENGGSYNIVANPASHTHDISQITWAANSNLVCNGANTEWSIDMNGAGSYWHVWSGTNGGSCLQCFNADRHSWAYKLYGAVWNDYAEFRRAEQVEYGRVVIEDKDKKMKLCNERLAAGAKISSDTFGISIGKSDEYNMPIAVSGRVLAFPYQERDTYELGAAVCSAPNGTVDIMTREEIMMYPERILGTVSEIPDYDIWYAGGQNERSGGGDPVQVKGRIWIYVR